jgi:hypothetical protein
MEDLKMEAEKKTWNVLTPDEIMKFQSVVATAPAGRVSGKYAFIPTTQVIEQFEKAAFYPVSIKEARAGEDRRGFQKHIVRFRHRDAEPVGEDGLFPEIVLTNSHDAGAAFILFAGIYRMICTNGLTIGEALTGKNRVNHVGYTDGKVLAAIHQVADNLPRALERSTAFKQIEVTNHDRTFMALAGLVERYGVEEVHRRQFETEALLRPTRTTDAAPVLWNTMNILQERLIEKGGQFERRRVDTKRSRWIERRTGKVTTRLVDRPGIKAPAETIRVNQRLWEMTEATAALHDRGTSWQAEDINNLQGWIKHQAEAAIRRRQENGEMVLAPTE